MTSEDMELLNDFVVESTEHLSEIENQLLQIESNGSNVDVDLVNTVFRAIHSIKGAAGFLGLESIGSLSHSLENVLNLIRSMELSPTPGIVDVMLKSADKLSALFDDITNSNTIDVSVLSARLDEIAKNLGLPEGAGEPNSEQESVQEIEQDLKEISDTTQKATENSRTEPTGDPVSQESTSEESATKNDMGLDDSLFEIKDGDDIDSKIAAAFKAREMQMAKMRETATVSPPPAADAKTNNVVESKSESTKPESSKASNADSSIRVSVNVLDNLMNLAGELVLARNQLLQTVNSNSSISSSDKSGLDAVTAGIDHVTSELQAAIMQTRMQPIGTVFNRFPRVVRDLSGKLSKKISLQMEGNEVEVDKSIIEAIVDPLTHIVRNSVDHGVESPEKRVTIGKNETGRILLRAYHQAGKVRIDIEDDGGGIDPEKIKLKAFEKGVINEEQFHNLSDREASRLIFHPGFSTAEKVTDISGRGVGMDVVRTNIEKLGGTVDIDSTLKVGTTIRVTLPLTLAIVPSLIVEGNKDRFAIPQSSIIELVRVRHTELHERIGRVKSAEVLRLRGTLLPLVRLTDVLTFDHPENIKQNPVEEDDDSQRSKKYKATNIVVLEANQFRYGLVVDGLHESEEIVVKPLGMHLRDIQSLAGATILGDGHIALILDAAGIAAKRRLTSISDEDKAENGEEGTLLSQKREDVQSILLFKNDPSEQFAIPMSIISRIECVKKEEIDNVGGELLLRYRNGTISLLILSRLISCLPEPEFDTINVVVFQIQDFEVGLLAPQLCDIRDIDNQIETKAVEETGVMGTFVLDDHTTRYLNLYELAEQAHPRWFEERRSETAFEPEQTKVLLVEDSTFFRRQLKNFVKSEGYNIIEAEDGVEGWKHLEKMGNQIDLVISDIEMPNMNGFELCSKIRGNDQTKNIPTIALTSLSDPADVKKGKSVGFDDYQVKMDKEKLIASMTRLLTTVGSPV